MRRLPRKRTEKQNLIIRAVKDYFGEANAEEKKLIVKIALWLMGRRRKLRPLTEKEEGVLERIRENLRDEIYLSSLRENTP